MFNRNNKNYTLIIIVIDIGLTLLALGLAKMLRETVPFGEPILEAPLPFTPWLYLIVGVVWIAVFHSLKIYDSAGPLQYKEIMSSCWGAVTIASFCFAGTSYLIFRDLSRLLFIYFYGLDLFFLYGWRWFVARQPNLVRKLYGTYRRRVLIIGTTRKGQELGQAIAAQSNSNLILAGFVEFPSNEMHQKSTKKLPILGTIDDVPRLIEEHRIQEVIFAISPARYSELSPLVLTLQDSPVNLRLIPDAFEIAVFRGPLENFDGVPIATLSEFPLL